MPICTFRGRITQFPEAACKQTPCTAVSPCCLPNGPQAFLEFPPKQKKPKHQQLLFMLPSRAGSRRDSRLGSRSSISSQRAREWGVHNPCSSAGSHVLGSVALGRPSHGSELCMAKKRTCKQVYPSALLKCSPRVSLGKPAAMRSAWGFGSGRGINHFGWKGFEC